MNATREIVLACAQMLGIGVIFAVVFTLFCAPLIGIVWLAFRFIK
jgi:hypothetical protein